MELLKKYKDNMIAMEHSLEKKCCIATQKEHSLEKKCCIATQKEHLLEKKCCIATQKEHLLEKKCSGGFILSICWKRNAALQPKKSIC